MSISPGVILKVLGRDKVFVRCFMLNEQWNLMIKQNRPNNYVKLVLGIYGWLLFRKEENVCGEGVGWGVSAWPRALFWSHNFLRSNTSMALLKIWQPSPTLKPDVQVPSWSDLDLSLQACLSWLSFMYFMFHPKWVTHDYPNLPIPAHLCPFGLLSFFPVKSNPTSLGFGS